MKGKTFQRERQRSTSVLLIHFSQSLENLSLKFEFMRTRYFKLTRWPGGKWSCSKPHAGILEESDHSAHTYAPEHTETHSVWSSRPPGRPVQCRAAVVCQLTCWLRDCVAAGQLVGRGHRNNCAHRFWSGICTCCFIGWKAILCRMRELWANTGKRFR